MRTITTTLAVLWIICDCGCETVVTPLGDDYTVRDSKQRSYSDAELERLRTLSEKYPKRADYHYRMAGIYFQDKEYRAAAACLERAVELDPEQARYHYNLGRVYMSMGELEEAQTRFERAVELAPANRYSGPLAALSYVHARKGELGAAVKGFLKCAEVEPENPEYYYFLGALYDMQGNEERAIYYFREYLRRGGNRYRQKAVFLLEKLGVKVEQREPETQRDPGPRKSFPLDFDFDEGLPAPGKPR